MRLNYRIYVVLLLSSLAVIGCNRQSAQGAPAKRGYTEVHTISAVKAESTTAMTDPHGSLTGNMPMDDTHSGVMRQMSQGQGEVPDMGMDMSVHSGMAGDQMQQMLNDSVAKVPLLWTIPQGWQEIPGNGIRLATFKSVDDKEPFECSLIALSGAAGGLESNVARWMGQIGLDVLSGASMQKFLSSQKKIKTVDGSPATIIDLAGIQSEKDPQIPSMIGTIIEVDSMTVFVKMMGGRGVVLKNKEKFESLCRSFKINKDGNSP